MRSAHSSSPQRQPAQVPAKGSDCSAVCAFIGDGSSKCQARAEAGYTFCAEHLDFLTRINVFTVFSELIAEQLGLDLSRIERSSRFVDDLGADSLEQVELIMAIEEAFELEIEDKEAEKFITVAQAYAHIISRILAKKRYVLASEVDVRLAFERLRANQTAARKHTITALRSPLFQDYLRKLGIPITLLDNLVCDCLAGSWVEHVTTVPVSNRENCLDAVEILLLTRARLVHLTLRRHEVAWRALCLSEILLWPRLSLDASGHVTALHVQYCVTSRDHAGGRTPMSRQTQTPSPQALVFATEQGISAGLAFLKKFYMFSHGVRP